MSTLKSLSLLSTGTGNPLCDGVTDDSKNISQSIIRIGLRLLFIFCLLAAIIVEGYYIVRLRSKISAQTEELKHISFQLQTMRNERDTLNERLTEAKGVQGEKKDGDTTHR